MLETFAFFFGVFCGFFIASLFMVRRINEAWEEADRYHHCCK